MPRLLAPTTSNPSLRGSKASFSSFGSGVGSRRKSSLSSFSKSGKGSQFSLTRRSSLSKQNLKSSASSLRRQKSSRQHSLLSYTEQAEVSNKNDEWGFVETPPKQNALWNMTHQPHDQPPQQNALWNIVNQGPQGSVSRGPPSLTASTVSDFTDHSSQASLPSSAHSPRSHSPPASLHSPVDDAKNDLLQRIAVHQLSLRRPANAPAASPSNSTNSAWGGATLQHPTILHATNSLHGLRTLHRSRRNSSFVPSSRIQEEDAWGHFVESSESSDDELHKNLLSKRRYPASFGCYGAASVAR